MRYKSFRKQDSRIIEEKIEAWYEMPCQFIRGLILGGQVVRHEEKLSEKVCADERIIELFQRKEKTDEKS